MGAIIVLEYDFTITWTHIIALVSVIFTVAGGWWKLQALGRSFTSMRVSVSNDLTRIETDLNRINDMHYKVRERVAILESQRIDDDRRISEVHENVKYIRDRIDKIPI